MTIAAIAIATAIAVTAISINTVPSFALATGSISPEAGFMMGHVEYVVRDANGNIKAYMQGDNEVVNKGDDCVITYVFGSTNAGGGDNCTATADGFRFIGIGNATLGTVTGTYTGLGASGAQTVAGGSPGAEGIMAIRADSNTVGSASSDGGTVVIKTENPFTFGATNATTVLGAGLFDANCTVGSIGQCTSTYTANMFSAQALNGGSGVAVTSGDSLDVTWTITVGNAD